MGFKIIVLLIPAFMYSCSTQKTSYNEGKIKLITLDPGHFHAALVQKSRYDDIDTNVFVYAPYGEDVNGHLNRIEAYNNRADQPTNWNEIVYTGVDYFEKMLADKKGNVVVLAGNNKKKTEYIKASVEAGFNVLSDKPMAITGDDFRLLEECFEMANRKGLLVYDMMTERSEITTILQRELSLDKDLFGVLEKGSRENPAITKESVHHFYKYVSGAALKRPAWFFDTDQQGEGITDVTTHLVDLIQWECFPEQIIDYLNDIEIVGARRWATPVTPAAFREITSLNGYPEYLSKYIKDSTLYVNANGAFDYKLKGVFARVSVIWNFKAPEGTGDTHYSTLRGTKANLIIRQGKDQNFKPALYIEPVDPNDTLTIRRSIIKIQQNYPGVEIKKSGSAWEVIIPEKYKVSHEEHFAQVTERFLQYIKKGKLPDWEVPNMLAKYYTTTQALNFAH